MSRSSLPSGIHSSVGLRWTVHHSYHVGDTRRRHTVGNSTSSGEPCSSLHLMSYRVDFGGPVTTRSSLHQSVRTGTDQQPGSIRAAFVSRAGDPRQQQTLRCEHLNSFRHHLLSVVKLKLHGLQHRKHPRADQAQSARLTHVVSALSGRKEPDQERWSRNVNRDNRGFTNHEHEVDNGAIDERVDQDKVTDTPGSSRGEPDYGYEGDPDYYHSRPDAAAAGGWADRVYGDPPPRFDTEGERWGPDITELTAQEKDKVLPGSATGNQYAYYWGGMDTVVRRVSVSLAGTILACNASPLIAVPAGLYWLWAPVALAARRNNKLRRYPYAGLWRAHVLSVGEAWAEGAGPRSPESRVEATLGMFAEPARSGRVLEVVVGELGKEGMRMAMTVPMERGLEAVRAGDLAELLVVGDRPGLPRFRALKEAYLPDTGVWLSEYPFAERSVFVDISDSIEYDRQAAAQGR